MSTSSPAKKKGEIFTATVRDLASDGRGILSHPNGLTVFVPGVWPGETCAVRFLGLQNRIGLGECVDLISPSPARIKPPCPHQGFNPGECGGCPWQFIRYDEQIAQKQQRVEQAFARIDFNNVKPLWASPQEFEYRNRAQLKTDGEVIGYLSANSRNIAPIEQCAVLNQHNQQTLTDLRAGLPNREWQVRRSGNKNKIQWTTLNIDDSLTAQQVLVNQRLPFQQSHAQQNARMRAWVQQQLNHIESPGPVLELFCGAGNFTEVIASTLVVDVLAVEGEQRSIDALTEKNLAEVKGLCLNLYDANAFATIYKVQRDFKVLVLDPPRDGLKNTAGLLPSGNTIANIFYISCNLSTLCRDIQFFQQHGFDIEEVQALDNAPHTPHIELLVHLKKSS